MTPTQYSINAQEAQTIRTTNNKELRALSGPLQQQFGERVAIQYNQTLEAAIKKFNRLYKIDLFSTPTEREITLWKSVWNTIKRFLSFEEQEHLGIK